MSEIQIRRARYGTASSRLKWFISKTPDNASSAPILYLHRDGVWRTSTRHDSKYTGYFPTKKKAKEVLDSLTEKENENGLATG